MSELNKTKPSYYEVQLLTECNSSHGNNQDFFMYRVFESRDAAFYTASLLSTFYPYRPFAANIIITEYDYEEENSLLTNGRIIHTLSFKDEFDCPVENVSPFLISERCPPLETIFTKEELKNKYLK